MITVLDPVRADAALRAGAMACGSCGRALSPWGWARPRAVAGPSGATVRFRPRRARCRSCAITHVLLPAQILPRVAATTELVGQVLLAAAGGRGYRTIADRVGLPADTVRRWLRRARANAEWLRCLGTLRAHQLDLDLPPLQPQPTRLALAVDALGAAAAAAARRFGRLGPPWPVIAAITRGQLLSASPRAIT